MTRNGWIRVYDARMTWNYFSCGAYVGPDDFSTTRARSYSVPASARNAPLLKYFSASRQNQT